MKISLVIRARNAANELKSCLQNVTDQPILQRCDLEIIVVDNDSIDATVEVASKYGALIESISTKDFSWGRSLNLGISKCSGSIVLILSADACPADRMWAEEMLKPFEDTNVAAVYGRQIPHSNAPIDEKIRIKRKFGESNIIARELPSDFTTKGGLFPASNACVAIRKQVWENLKYDETIAGAEDVVWTYHVLKEGYTVVYQASALVYHSHGDKLFRAAWRRLELIKKDAELSCKRLENVDYLKHLLSFSKKRVNNCLSPSVPIRDRFQGLILLPFELFSTIIVSFFFHDNERAAKYRHIFWE